MPFLARLVDSLSRDVDKSWNLLIKSNLPDKKQNVCFMVLGDALDLFVLELPDDILGVVKYCNFSFLIFNANQTSVFYALRYLYFVPKNIPYQ